MELTTKDYSKYLGVILDCKQMWKFNAEEKLKKVSGLYM